MPPEPLDERYFSWLCGQVASLKTRARSRTHWSLLRQLHDKEFVWLVPHDDNRVEDGRDLRHEFLAEFLEQGDPRWEAKTCSMLELLIVLARQISFEMDEDSDLWFWHLIEVLGVKRFNDSSYDSNAFDQVDAALERVINRTYSRNGSGGLFPLRHADEDQREVELWYQLNAYLLEQF